MPAKPAPQASLQPTRTSSRLKTPSNIAQQSLSVSTPTRASQLSKSTNGINGSKKGLNAIQEGPANGSREETRAASPTKTSGKKASLGAAREPIRAFLRIRPSPSESSNGSPYLTVLSPTAVLMDDSSQSIPSSSRRLTSAIEPATYTFTHVFPSNTSQVELFQSTTQPFVQDLLKGENGLIFAYGVSNSGKTYTVQGGDGPGEGGLLPRTLDVVFNSVEGKMSNAALQPVGLAGVTFDPDTLTDIDFGTASTSMGLTESQASDEVIANLLRGVLSSQASLDKTKIELDDNHEYAIWVSYVEIYNEKIYDLLDADCSSNPPPSPTKRSISISSHGLTRSNTFSGLSAMKLSFNFNRNLASLSKGTASSPAVLTRKALSLRADTTSPGGGKSIAGLKELRVKTAEEAKRVLTMGQINRRVFGTRVNEQSSRSHAVFTIRVVRVKKGADLLKDSVAVHTSRLSIVDLAGSERHRNTGVTGERLKEAGSINKSLMVLGQCLEGMKANQKRADNGRGSAALIPFNYSKLTEIFQDYFEGDGKVAMIVNVNPFDTGFDENTHVMKFSALAREVTTTVGGPTKGKQASGTMVKLASMASRIMNRPAKRTVSIVTKPRGEMEEPKEALWEVVEADEDEPEEHEDDLVDKLFDVVENLKQKLYEAELRYAMAEVEIREEVAEEYEERIREMEETFARRRRNDEQENEDLMDRKIDLLYRGGILGGPREQSSATTEEDEMEDLEDVDASLVVDGEEEEEDLSDPERLGHFRPSDAMDGESEAMDNNGAPGRSKLSMTDPKRTSGVVVKASGNKAKPSKQPALVRLYDVSMDAIAIIPAKGKTTTADREEDNDMECPPLAKKRKRVLGNRNVVNQDAIMEMSNRVEGMTAPRKTKNVRRMA